jgi:hypothetical protein
MTEAFGGFVILVTKGTTNGISGDFGFDLALPMVVVVVKVIARKLATLLICFLMPKEIMRKFLK